MKNQQRIMTSLRFLQQYLDEIEQIVPATYDEYMQSLIIRRSSERQIQIIIEQVSDICALLCRDVFSKIPGDDASILDILSETWFIFRNV